MANIIYIAGYGHSGSTVLGVLLGDLPDALNLGEAAAILKDPTTLSRGGAAEPPFGELSGNIIRLLEKYQHIELAAAEGYFTPGEVAAHADFWTKCFELIKEETGCRLLIDSSKTAHATLRRPELLRQAGHEVVIIHLVRDPRGVLYSLYKKDRKRRRRFAGLKYLASWMGTNIITALKYRGPKTLCITYEALVGETERELTRLGDFCGTDLSSILSKAEAGGVFQPGLQIDGNRMSRAGPIRLRADLAWRREAPLRVRALGRLGVPLYYGLKRRSSGSRPDPGPLALGH